MGQRKKTEVRQKQIIEAAQRLICRYGSEHLTVKRISAEVGISEAAIYKHFKSKKSILAFLIDHLETVLLSDIQDEISKDSLTIDSIEKRILNHFSSINKRRGMSFQVVAEIISLGDKNLNKKTSLMISSYVDNIKEILVEGVKSGCVRKDLDLEAAAILLFCMIQGLVNIWALSNNSFDLLEKFSALWSIYRESVVQR